MLSFYSHIRAWKNFLQLCKGNSKVGLEGNSQQWEWRKQCVWWGGEFSYLGATQSWETHLMSQWNWFREETQKHKSGEWQKISGPCLNSKLHLHMMRNTRTCPHHSHASFAGEHGATSAGFDLVPGFTAWLKPRSISNRGTFRNCTLWTWNAHYWLSYACLFSIEKKNAL